MESWPSKFLTKCWYVKNFWRTFWRKNKNFDGVPVMQISMWFLIGHGQLFNQVYVKSTNYYRLLSWKVDQSKILTEKQRFWWCVSYANLNLIFDVGMDMFLRYVFDWRSIKIINYAELFWWKVDPLEILAENSLCNW